MQTLLEVKQKVDEALGPLETNKLEIPEPAQIWKDRLEALEEQKLTQQYESCLFDMRCEQAEQMGFEPLESDVMVQMLMGEKHSDEESEDNERQVYEWVYNHHTDEVWSKSEGWGGKRTDFVLYEKKGLWFLPPFKKTESWRCRFGKLDYLRRSIPYGVLLRINELKRIRMFNAFNVLAPIEAWEKKSDIDPIVVGSIWELPYNDNKKKYNSAGSTQHFFIAQW